MGILDGKVALVTGAAGKAGLGHAIARRLAGEGADLVVTDICEVPKTPYAEDKDWRGLHSVAEETAASGRSALVVTVDVSNSKEVEELVAKSLARFGKIDILVNCAGVPGTRNLPVTNIPEEDWRRTIEVNLTGAFLISKATARDMVRRGEGGKIVHISSWFGKTGHMGRAPYSASKFGLIGLVQCMAQDLAQYRINVNAICPGPFITGMRDNWIEKVAKEPVAQTPHYRCDIGW